MSVLNEISEALSTCKLPKVKELCKQALDSGISAPDILNDGLLAGMAVVGEKFKNNKMFVPEVMLAAKCMQAGTDIIKDGLSANANNNGCAVIGTVKGDRHDIGKNLCKLMLEGKGLSVIDLGVNVTAEKFVEEAKKNSANVICASALLTTTMPEMKRIVELLDKEGLHGEIKLMVGGAPVTGEYAASIGADAYTSDAAQCADKAVELCGK